MNYIYNEKRGGFVTTEASQKENAQTSNTQIASPAPYEVNSKQDVYNSLFRRLNDAIAYCKVLYDEAGQPIDFVLCDVNPAFNRITHVNIKQMLGLKASDFLPDLTKQYCEWLKKCGKAVATRRALTMEKYFASLDKWLIFNGYCPEQGYFAIVIKDITAHRKTEQALRQSEKQYRKLADSITDPFFALNASLKVNYWNQACEKATGIAEAEAMGKQFFNVFKRGKLTRKAARVYVDVMRTRKPRTITDKLPNCGDTIFEIQIYPTGNGISVFAKDVTERAKLQDSLEQYTKGLEEQIKIRTEKLKNAERFAAIGETAGMVGHDIRNPLQSIIGELYLAKEDLNGLPQSEIKENLLSSINLIEEQTLYINKIVSDLQDFAKQSVPTIQDVNFEYAIQDVIAGLDIPEKITISYAFKQPFPNLKSDPVFIKRIFTNLALNGIQAMEVHGGKLAINAFSREKSVIIAISDTGVGIPEEVRSNMFKPLFTTKSKGQGFGLAVVKKLVEALGGNVSFESKIGKGTTFIIELPLEGV